MNKIDTVEWERAKKELLQECDSAAEAEILRLGFEQIEKSSISELLAKVALLVELRGKIQSGIDVIHCYLEHKHKVGMKKLMEENCDA